LNSDFVVAEKCLIVLSAYAKCCGVERLIDSPPDFIMALESLVPLSKNQKPEFTKTYAETFLRTLQTVFSSFDISSL